MPAAHPIAGDESTDSRMAWYTSRHRSWCEQVGAGPDNGIDTRSAVCRHADLHGRTACQRSTWMPFRSHRGIDMANPTMTRVRLCRDSGAVSNADRWSSALWPGALRPAGNPPPHRARGARLTPRLPRRIGRAASRHPRSRHRATLRGPAAMSAEGLLIAGRVPGVLREDFPARVEEVGARQTSL